MTACSFDSWRLPLSFFFFFFLKISTFLQISCFEGFFGVKHGMLTPHCRVKPKDFTVWSPQWQTGSAAGPWCHFPCACVFRFNCMYKISSSFEKYRIWSVSLSCHSGRIKGIKPLPVWGKELWQWLGAPFRLVWRQEPKREREHWGFHFRCWLFPVQWYASFTQLFPVLLFSKGGKLPFENKNKVLRAHSICLYLFCSYCFFPDVWTFSVN